MAPRRVQFSPGEYYHVYNRGCNRQNIFRTGENYLFLIGKLKEKVPAFCVSVIAYCLMPNHYHFLVRQDGDRPAGELVQSVFNSYTKAFNVMYNRSGTLFERPFKAIHVDKLAYLIHLCCYIHRNPLEARLVGSLKGWKYSNYLEWIEKRNWGLVDRKFIKENFSSPKEYERFVLEYEASTSIASTMDKYLLD